MSRSLQGENNCALIRDELLQRRRRIELGAAINDQQDIAGGAQVVGAFRQDLRVRCTFCDLFGKYPTKHDDSLSQRR